MLKRLLFDSRGAESTEYVVIGAIIILVMSLVLVNLLNQVQTEATLTDTTVGNCVPNAAQAGAFTGCQ